MISVLRRLLRASILPVWNWRNRLDGQSDILANLIITVAPIVAATTDIDDQ